MKNSEESLMNEETKREIERKGFEGCYVLKGKSIWIIGKVVETNRETTTGSEL